MQSLPWRLSVRDVFSYGGSPGGEAHTFWEAPSPLQLRREGACQELLSPPGARAGKKKCEDFHKRLIVGGLQRGYIPTQVCLLGTGGLSRVLGTSVPVVHGDGFMRMIQAVLAPERLQAVAARLAEAEIFRMTVSEVHGVSDLADVAISDVSSDPMVRIEVGVNEEFVEGAIEAIEQGGGDRGRIFTFDLHDVVRIRTGETGPEAI